MLATTLTEIKDYATIIGFIFTCVGVVILVFKSYTDPDKKSEKSIAINNATCVQKHTRIDEIFKEMKDEIKGINYTFVHFKENEFRHIEEEMRRMSDTQTEIMTIFKERDKK